MRGGGISENEFRPLHKIFCKYLKLYEMDTSNDSKKEEVSNKEKNLDTEVLSLYKKITGKDINKKDKFGNEDSDFLNLDSFIFHNSLIYRINDLTPGPVQETVNKKFYTTYIETFIKIF